METRPREQDSEKLLQHITQRIVEAVDPERIILFGSRAKDMATEHSDIDLCVIAKHDGARRELGQRIHGLFPRRRFSMDVIVRSPQEYKQESQLINSISYFIAKHGTVLYERT